MAEREMTNKEAIEILGGIRACYNIFDEYDEPKYAALSKAIFALKTEPIKHGRWIVLPVAEWGASNTRCSVCGYEDFQPMVLKGIVHKHCPDCGTKMDLIGEDKSHPFAESVMMGMDGGEE